MKTSGRWPYPLNVDFQIPLKHLHISLIKKKCLKAQVLWITQQICQNFKKKIKFQRKSCKCFTDHRNSQTTWLRGMQKLSWKLDAMYKWAKSGETGRGSALKRCRGGFELTFILQGSSGWKDPLVPTSEFSASRFQQQKHFLFWMLLWSERECVCYFNFLNFEATSLFSHAMDEFNVTDYKCDQCFSLLAFHLYFLSFITFLCSVYFFSMHYILDLKMIHWYIFNL